MVFQTSLLRQTEWEMTYFIFFYPLHPVLKKTNQYEKMEEFHSKGPLRLGL